MRFYSFSNMYLSSIQNGIQSAHAIHEMFNNWRDESSDQAIGLRDWSENHKTMILLNAGYSDNIRNLIGRFESNENTYAWAPFYEGQDSLDGALTTVAIILPPKIYETASMLRSIPFRKKESVIESIQNTGEVAMTVGGEDVTWGLSKWEFELILELGNYGMAS